MESPLYARLDCLDRIGLVVQRGGWARKIVDLVHFHVQRKADIVPEHFKSRMTQQMSDILSRAGVEIIDTEHLMPFRKEPLAKMRAQKTCAACDQIGFCHARLSVFVFLKTLTRPDHKA